MTARSLFSPALPSAPRGAQCSGPRLAIVSACAGLFFGVGAGCGDAGGDGVADPDASVGDAPAGTCVLGLALDPDDALVSPGILKIQALVDATGSAGFEALEWRVWLDDTRLLDFQPLSDSRWISVDLGQGAGAYRAQVSGSVGATECIGAELRFNVAYADAIEAAYVLRAVPPAGSDSMVQTRALTVQGGAHARLDHWSLESGALFTGDVRRDAGEGVAAYLRFSGPESGAAPIETFSNAQTGAFSARLVPDERYRLLLVPTQAADLAPARIESLSAAQAPLSLILNEGALLSGTVLDSTDAPIAGARVSAHIDGVPTTVTETTAGGAFALRAHASTGILSISVVPPAGSGLPTLDVPAEANLLAMGEPLPPLIVRFSGAPTPRVLDGLTLYASDGVTPAPGARVTLYAPSMPAGLAGTVTIGTQSAGALGSVRASASADQDGILASLRVPEAVYQNMVIEPDPATGESTSLVTLDLTPGVPAPTGLTLAPAARVFGTIHDPDDPSGPPLAHINVFARPLGVLASASSAAAHDSSGDGSFALDLVGGGSYELSLIGQDPRFAPTRLTVDAPAPGQSLDLGSVLMRRAVKLSGSVSIAGRPGGAAGVHLMLLCYQCAGVDAQRPITEALTSATGEFELLVPDPGRTGDAP